MQYGEFEKILADIFSIKEKNLGAFRARLRHLRNLGLPDIPKRGSGNVFIYKTADLLGVSVALELQTVGLAPAVSAQLAAFARKHLTLVQESKSDVFLVVTHPFNRGSDARESPVKAIRAKAGEQPPSGYAKVIAPPGVRDFQLMTNPLGGSTDAFIIEGAAEAGAFVTRAAVASSSMINISQHFRALPRGA